MHSTQQSSNSEKNTPTKISAEQIEWIFQIFTATYGNRFKIYARAETMKVWQETLSKKVGNWEKVRQGMGKAFDEHPEMPPTLPQFVALCNYQTPEMYKPIKRLTVEEKARNRAVAMKEIDKCRELLKAAHRRDKARKQQKRDNFYLTTEEDYEYIPASKM
jgi:hypothetical protein